MKCWFPHVPNYRAPDRKLKAVRGFYLIALNYYFGGWFYLLKQVYPKLVPKKIYPLLPLDLPRWQALDTAKQGEFYQPHKTTLIWWPHSLIMWIGKCHSLHISALDVLLLFSPRNSLGLNIFFEWLTWETLLAWDSSLLKFMVKLIRFLQSYYEHQMFRKLFTILGTSDTLHSCKVLIAKGGDDYPFRRPASTEPDDLDSIPCILMIEGKQFPQLSSHLHTHMLSHPHPHKWIQHILIRFIYFISCIWVFCMLVCMFNIWLGTCKDQMKASDLQELGMVVRHHVSAGNWNRVLCKRASAFNSWTVSPVTVQCIF